MVSAASTEPSLKTVFSGKVRGGNRRAPRRSARSIAERLKEKGITRVVFDRGGNLYHGRVRAVADAARKAGWSSEAHGAASREDRRRQRLELKDTVVSISRVTKVVKGGKNLSFSALVVIGDGHGVVGFGIGKAKEVPSAIKKAIESAKKALVRVPMAGTAIPHPVLGRFGAGSVLLKPAPDGTGIIAGGAVRAVVESAGHSQRADQVAGVGQRAQRRARDVRRADDAAGSGGGGAAARQGARGARRRADAVTSEDVMTTKSMKVTQIRSGSGSTRSRRWRCAGSACGGSATRSKSRTRRPCAGWS